MNIGYDFLYFIIHFLQIAILSEGVLSYLLTERLLFFLESNQTTK